MAARLRRELQTDVEMVRGHYGEFKILVQPKETAHQSTANLVIKPDKAAGENKVFNASARVMPSSS